MSKFQNLLRSAVLAAIVIGAAFLCGLRLLEIQIADGSKYLAMTQSTHTATQDIEAARGKIADSTGKILNTNELNCSVKLQKASLESGTENEVIYRILTILMKHGDEWNETLPITRTQPYQFEKDRDNAVDSLKSRMKLGVYATVENCMNALYENYKISDQYEEPMRRCIAGVRYEMELKGFNNNNPYELASGISSDTVLELKELSALMPGMEISEGWNRVYLDGTTAPHIRGTVGAISADKYAELKSAGYKLDDIIGTSGIELALESTLRGERGTREITRNSDGMMISDEITKDSAGGEVRNADDRLELPEHGGADSAVPHGFPALPVLHHGDGREPPRQGYRGRLRSRAGRQGRLSAGDGDAPELRYKPARRGLRVRSER